MANSIPEIPIPTTQTAALIENPGPDATVVVRDNLPVATPGPNEVLVKLEYSGVCGSEIRALNAWGVYNPIVGHEGVGTVVQAGKNKTATALLGQRVGIKWLYSACDETGSEGEVATASSSACSACRRGFANNCARQLNTGKQVPGTLQQYAVADARFVTTNIPSTLPSEIAAPLLCAGLTMMGAQAKVDAHVGSLPKNEDTWVVISGAGGGLGHLGVQLASSQKAGRYKVIAIDHGEAKRQQSLDAGAHFFIDYGQSDDEIEKKVKDLTGGEGAHAVIVVSGAQAAFRTAPRLVRNMGVLVTVGLPVADFMLPVSAALCSARSLTVTGVSVGTEEQMSELLQLAAAGKVTPAVEVRTLHEVHDVIEQLRTDSVTGRIVVKIPE
ncbi:hypothetical protein SBRCBS47491_004419 [Sporothrix bragantina]|uniref:Enoyl reductase (ER) domain-containing protein n=1 Tax=Sporothrix bragantina TaxID=671064 RepID=A0ABP0BPY8_9PEZI